MRPPGLSGPAILFGYAAHRAGSRLAPDALAGGVKEWVFGGGAVAPFVAKRNVRNVVDGVFGLVERGDLLES